MHGNAAIALCRHEFGELCGPHAFGARWRQIVGQSELDRALR
jgi:hypothetical protein